MPRLRYYIDVLGLTNADWGGDDVTCVSRDNAAIYLCQGDQGRPQGTDSNFNPWTYSSGSKT